LRSLPLFFLLVAFAVLAAGCAQVLIAPLGPPDIGFGTERSTAAMDAIHLEGLDWPSVIELMTAETTYGCWHSGTRKNSGSCWGERLSVAR